MEWGGSNKKSRIIVRLWNTWSPVGGKFVTSSEVWLCRGSVSLGQAFGSQEALGLSVLISA